MPLPARLTLLSCLLLRSATALPSCEDDVGAHCLGDDADMSPEGIAACLAALGESRSADCSTFIAIEAGCKADLEGSGACADAAVNGEAMACLLQRVKPEALSAECQAALPTQEAAKGLKKFWADGKRELLIGEIMDLNADEKDTYEKWKKKKKGRKTDKDRERDYAIKQAKLEKVERLVTEAAAAAAKELVAADGDAAELKKAVAAKVAAAWKTAMDEDMTGTLTALDKKKEGALAAAAIKAAKSELKSEL